MEYINIVNIYMGRKAKELANKKDEDIIAIKVTDKNYKTIRDLKKNNEKCAGLISLANYKFSDKINDKIAEVRAAYDKDVKALKDLCTEVLARLDITSTYDEGMAVLTSYGIIKDNKINA